MTKTPVYLYPEYVELTTLQQDSPLLYKALGGYPAVLGSNKKFVKFRWSGELKLLPANQPVLVRASSRLNCSRKELAHWVYQRRHLAFYKDKLVLPNGTLGDTLLLLGALTVFMENAESFA